MHWEWKDLKIIAMTQGRNLETQQVFSLSVSLSIGHEYHAIRLDMRIADECNSFRYQRPANPDNCYERTVAHIAEILLLTTRSLISHSVEVKYDKLQVGKLCILSHSR